MQIERVYLGDWLFNAGIVGFMRIVLGGVNLDNQNAITIGDNYIEFDRSIMTGFAQKYFQTAFDQYGRYQKLKNDLARWKEQLQQLTEPADKEPLSKEALKKIKDIEKTLKARTNFKLLKLKMGSVEPVKANPGDESKESEENERSKGSEEERDTKKTKSNPEKLLLDILKIETILTDNYQEFFESDAKIYTGKIYGQKDFLGRSIKTGMLNMFKKSFEDAVLNDSCNKDKKYDCVCCGNRKAKKDVNFDTGLSPFLAANKDAVNYAWNFNPKFPLCDICELIYFCSFAGLTDFSTRYGKKTFYYVNRDSSVKNLYQANILLMSLLNKNIDDNPVVQFFSELLLKSEDQKALYAIQNTSFIELDLENSTFPSVFSYNISREKARLIHEHSEDFKALASARYSINKDSFNAGFETMRRILNDTASFLYAGHLLHAFLSSKRGNGNSRIFFNAWHIQKVVLIINDFIQNNNNKEVNIVMESKELWSAYHKGKEMAGTLRKRDAENKINSIAYKLLNAVRAEDTGTFMEVLIRVYLAYDKDMPSIFVKTLSSKNDFPALGYSFINGLLGKEYENNADNAGGNANGN